MKYRSMKYVIIGMIMIGGLLSACNKWIDIVPENQRLSENYWQSEADIKNTVLNCYVRMRPCVDILVRWGELRADVLTFTGLANVDDEDALLLNEQNITSVNKWTSWYEFYHVINAANSVVQYAPLVLENDPLLTQANLEKYIAEAKAIRALMYFYLVRTFGEVPLVIDAYMTDGQTLKIAKDSEEKIIEQIIADLLWASKRLDKSYAKDGNWENKCRVTLGAAQLLLADVYLWSEQYEKCLPICSDLLKSNEYELIASGNEDTNEEGEENEEGDEDEEDEDETWFENFYPGLTRESVWELFFDHEAEQENNLYKEFDNNDKYKVRENVMTSFETNDVRGLDNSFIDDGKVWKYVGTQNNGAKKRPKKERSPNWIFYRYAELYFIYAEASVMRNVIPTATDSKIARNALNMLRLRAKVSLLDESDVVDYTQSQWLSTIMDDKKKEFIGEGKRWFDMVRLAKKQDFTIYKALVLEILLENVPFAEKAIFQTKLSHSGSFFLPINQDEIYQGRGVLIQNPAYQ